MLKYNYRPVSFYQFPCSSQDIFFKTLNINFYKGNLPIVFQMIVKRDNIYFFRYKCFINIDIILN